MEVPGIQYAKTADGVNIAYWTLGSGPPLIQLSPLPSVYHLQFDWSDPEFRQWYEKLAENWTVIGFDGRGVGMSEKGDFEITLDAVLLDLEAVVDKVGFPKFHLFGWARSGPVAMTYAARHPERVDRLVLFHTWADTSAFVESPRMSSLYALLEKDYQQFLETFMHTALGWSGTTGHQTAALAREWIPQEAWRALLRGSSTHNATSVLAKIECPTLILHRPQATLIDVAYARELAAGIPGSRLTLLEGESVAPFGSGTEDVLAAMLDFFMDDGGAPVKPPLLTANSPSTLKTILFTDIESHTAMMQRLGDQKGREVLREHERITREALAAHGGAEVKTMGDGFMASFGSTQKAIECAIALQKAFAAKEGEALRVRVGINVGEPIAEDDDLFGSSVILAARTAAQAQGGEILVTDVVRQLVAGKGFLFADRGETEMRGFEDPVRLYEVRWTRDEA